MGFLQYVVSRDDVRHICLWFLINEIRSWPSSLQEAPAGNPIPVIKVNLMLSVRLNKNTGSGRSLQRKLLTFRAGEIICIRGSSLRFHTFNCVAPVCWWAAVRRIPVPMLSAMIFIGFFCMVGSGPGRLAFLLILQILLWSNFN